MFKNVSFSVWHAVFHEYLNTFIINIETTFFNIFFFSEQKTILNILPNKCGTHFIIPAYEVWSDFVHIFGDKITYKYSNSKLHL